MDVNPTTALLGNDIVDGVVDYRGRPVSRHKAGAWRSAFFIMGGEVAERFAFYGIGSNLINYLTGPFGKPMAEAATIVDVWSGCACVFPLLGAFLGDSFLGRYRTVVIASLLYILGSSLVTLSALSPSLHPQQCPEQEITCPPPTRFQTLLLFTSLYLVAIAQGGHKPCVQAFGADQYDVQDPKESLSRSSFFNWLNFFLCIGTGASMIIVTYIQDNKSWGFGFCLPCFSIVAAFALFLVGTPCYRFTRTKNRGGLGKSFFRDVGDESRDVPFSSIFAPDEERLLNEARDVRKWTWTGLIEEAKQVSNLIPIWATCIFYGVVAAQPPSLFTKQGGAMDRRFPGHDFQVPAAALQSCIAFTMVVLLPIYDRVFVPAARLFTKLPSGITMLQRIGTGLLVSVAAMVAAAAVERRRLALAGAAEAAAAARMSVWWLLPQYVLFGVAHVFVYVGSSEFFYDQMPEGLRSLGIAFCLTIFGVGSFLSGILVWVVDAASSANGASWFDTDLDRAHLDYFYWLVAATSATGFGLFLYLAKSYVYKIK